VVVGVEKMGGRVALAELVMDWEWVGVGSMLRVNVLKVGSAVKTWGVPAVPSSGAAIGIGEYIGGFIPSWEWEDVVILCSGDRPYAPGLSSTLFSLPVISMLLPLVLWLLESSEEGLLFCILQRLVPLERKLPKLMDPFALMKGVVRCCWLG